MMDAAVYVIVNHLKILVLNLKEKVSELKQIAFPTWVMQSMLALFDVSMQYKEELLEI